MMGGAFEIGSLGNGESRVWGLRFEVKGYG